MNGAIDTCICERPMVGTGYDAFSVHWTDGHYTVGQKPIISDMETWQEELKIPDVNKIDWTPAIQSAAGRDPEKDKISATLMMGPFERATTLTSYTDCMMNLGEEPELFADMIGALADYRIAVLRKLHEFTGLNSVLLHDDWGSNKAMLMSPNCWRQVIKPHTQRIYDACKEMGIEISQHSCGHIQEIISDLVEMGADSVELQSTCNDMDYLNKMYGDKIEIRTNDFVVPPGGAAGPDMPPPFGGTVDMTVYPEPPTYLY